MTSAYFYFNQAQLDTADSYRQSGNYPAMYNTLSQAVRAGGGDPRLANWLTRAGEINSGRGFYAEFVRGAVYEAGREAGKNIDAAVFQRVSNMLAMDVMADAIRDKRLSFDNVISRDVGTAIGGEETGGLGLSPDKWAGTVGAAFPIGVGGLGMDPDSEFYQNLEKYYRENGYDPYQRADRLFDLIDDNVAGAIHAAQDPIARNEIATKIAIDAIMQYSALIQQQLGVAKIISELGSDVVQSDGQSWTWDGVRDAAKQFSQMAAGLHWYQDFLQGTMNMAKALAEGSADVFSGAEATWKRWIQPLFDHLREMIRDSITDGVDAVKQRLHDWRTHLGDAFQRLANQLHKDSDAFMTLLHDLFGYQRDVRDPLVLDLDGDGIETVAAGKNILFDHDGDGIKHASGWIKSDDGLLVLDRNGNGHIDDGSELFGADTLLANGQKATSGFEALRDLDSNGDGVFDAGDTRFTDVRVWRDLNQDGRSQTNELFTLSSLGIASIALTPTDTQRVNLNDGNFIDGRGTYTRSDGRTGVVGNLQLGLDHFYRDYNGAHAQVTVSEAARALPAITGSGAVRDLQEAASQSPALLAAVQALLSGTTPGTLRAALDQVIALWADTSTMRSSEERLEASGDMQRNVYYQWFVPAAVIAQGQEAVQTWTQQQHARLGPIIGILEKFNGSTLVSDHNGQISMGGQIFSWNRVVHPDGHGEEVMTFRFLPEQFDPLIDPFTKAYAHLKESIYIRLVLQQRLSDYLSGLTMTYHHGVMGWDASGVHAKLDDTWQHNKAQALQDAMDLYRYGSDALAGSDWKPLDTLRDMIDRTAAAPDGIQALKEAGTPFVSGDLEGSAAADIMFGDAGANTLSGGAGDDVLSGGGGDDTLYGGEGNDILRGDAGNDLLYGSSQNNTYLFNQGDGHDTLVDQGGSDTIVFGTGIAASDIRGWLQGQDVVLDLGNGHDSIRFKNRVNSDGGRDTRTDIEQITFADGTVWTGKTLNDMALTTQGTSGNDTLQGWQGRDTMLGGAGDDTLSGRGGDDVLLGGDGNDLLDGGSGSNRLEGGAGNDVLKVSAYYSSDNVLSGGTGDDTLYGSNNSDTYLFEKGDGHDTLVEQGGTDKLVLGAGIAASDVKVLREGQDVVLDLGNGHDSIRLKDWLTSDGYRSGSADIEQIVFADGTVWTGETLSDIGLTTIGTSGNDTLQGWQGRDILLGGAGDDVLSGGAGSNRLEGGAGNDVLKVSAYYSSDNVLSGGTGDDTLYGSIFADTYLFNQGDGHDTLVEQGGTDKLVLGAGIVASDVKVLREGQDVVLDLGNGHDSIRLKDWLTSDGYRSGSADIEQIVFADGTVWTGETLSDIGLTTIGTSGNDTLQGWQGRDILLGGAGDDVLSGGAGSNRLEGGAGNDVLKVSAYYSSDNVLSGGTGDDTLYGSDNADTYLFNQGDGHDTLVDQGGSDTLVLGTGIAASDIRGWLQGQDVVLDLGNGHDSIRFKNRVNSDGGRDTRTDIEQITFADGTVWTGKTLNDMALTTQGTSGNDTLNGWEGRDTMLGGAGDDTLSGRGGDDVLLGGDGNDLLDGGSGSNRLEGGAGNDVLKVSAYYSSDNVLSGGTGDDTLYGSIFADTYLFNQGDGHDTIVEQGGTDKLVLGAGIVASDVKVLREGQDVVLDLGNGHDSIRLKDWLTSDGYRSSTAHIEQIVFADGTVWTGETLSDIGLTTIGTSGDDTLQGWQGRDILLGGAGDDVLSGGAGSNRLEGGAGNDVLKVSAYYSSDNVLSGGTGDDTLYGSNNSDTYLFEKGDGHDTLVEQGGTDKLVLGAGIVASDVKVLREGQDVVLDLGNGHDSIRLKDWLTSDGYRSSTANIEQIVFADGTVWTGETLSDIGLTTIGTSGDDTLQGWQGRDILLGGAGDDVLSGGAGTNRLEGGAGNDVLKVSAYYSSDNVLNGGTGDDTLYGSDNADTYLFNQGDGHDTLVDQGGTDTLVLGTGIAASDIRGWLQGQDVVLDLGNGHDSIRFKNRVNSDGGRDTRTDIEQITFADGTVWTGKTLNDMALTTQGTSGNDTLNGWEGRDTMLGGAGDDTLSGRGGDDVLLGGDGNDLLDGGSGSNRLEGGAGNDVLKVSAYYSSDNVLSGGTGDDTLYGSIFADTYLFNQGDGHDTIVEQGGTDKLVLGAGIVASDVKVLREGQDVVLDLGNGHDSIRLKDWLTSDGYRSSTAHIEQIVFADGTVWTGETLSDIGLTTVGTSGDNTLQGWQGRDILLGGAGDDVLSGGAGTNRLEGGAGNDVLKVSAYYSSDNVLSGGTGDDTLYGSDNADTYLFNQGDGHDTLVDQGGSDTLVLGTGIAASDIRGWLQGQDVVLDLGNGHDSIRFKNRVNSDGGRDTRTDIEQITFADGTVWTGKTLNDMALTTQGTSGNDTLNGWEGRDTMLGGAGDDTLSGRGGDDVLLGGDGNDLLDGGSGSNRLEGGAGNDVLKVSAYYSSDNVLSGGTGDDTLYGSIFADTYLFNQGDGHDTLVEQGGTDRLVFGEGLHREEALFTKSGDDLSILFNHGDDQVTVAGWFSTPAHQVESFVFQDGTVLSGEVERLIAAMAMPSAVTTTQATVRDTNEHHLLVASSIV
ncbi:calcium-binding protein [Xylella taiwanensis]|uniref:calcium-binding protein n=1 Tax=Xylella taiwanensis TaxID=1444770 RepID=UPI001E311F39|nr:calcium-binding protein [Xylella taiwanensis]MCD8460845.1 bacteriocin [Xylella taiwanensis]